MYIDGGTKAGGGGGADAGAPIRWTAKVSGPPLLGGDAATFNFRALCELNLGDRRAFMQTLGPYVSILET